MPLGRSNLNFLQDSSPKGKQTKTLLFSDGSSRSGGPDPQSVKQGHVRGPEPPCGQGTALLAGPGLRPQLTALPGEQVADCSRTWFSRGKAGQCLVSEERG